MKKPTTISKESVSEYREFVQLRLRKRVLEAIEVVLEEEVDQALGCGSYERAEDRRGYRNGAETRRVTTSVGTRELRVPRARVRDEETGETTEFRSELLPRYARRTREVDEAILGTYLSGANSRRIRKALKPLLGEEHLSKSAVSRVVSRLKERFEEWQNRALSEEVYAIVYLDGFHLKVRMAKRVISVPVLVALGVAPDGHKRLLSLRLAVSEASTHWGSVLEGLQARGLRAPKLVISDGHKGLTKALEKWPGCRLQRCTEHKRANLLEHCPAHARRELRRDYNRIVYAKNGIDARKAYDELVAKWTPLAPAVVRSLEEAGNQLLTFYEFPRAMWKSIRTTNALENLNREFRRRTKTQASFSSEESAVALLFGLIASGQIQLRRIDGYQRLSEVLERAEVAAGYDTLMTEWSVPFFFHGPRDTSCSRVLRGFWRLPAWRTPSTLILDAPVSLAWRVALLPASARLDSSSVWASRASTASRASFRNSSTRCLLRNLSDEVFARTFVPSSMTRSSVINPSALRSPKVCTNNSCRACAWVTRKSDSVCALMFCIPVSH